MLQENQRKEIEALRAGYEKKEVSALDELKRTDSAPQRSSLTFSALRAHWCWVSGCALPWRS